MGFKRYFFLDVVFSQCGLRSRYFKSSQTSDWIHQRVPKLYCSQISNNCTAHVRTDDHIWTVQSIALLLYCNYFSHSPVSIPARHTVLVVYRSAYHTSRFSSVLSEHPLMPMCNPATMRRKMGAGWGSRRGHNHYH